MIDFFIWLLEKIGWAWWEKHELAQHEARRPLDNEEEVADIDNLPRR